MNGSGPGPLLSRSEKREEGNQLKTDARFWTAVIAIAALATLFYTFPATWSVPLRVTMWCLAAIWQGLTGQYAVPGWAWTLIALVFIGLIATTIRAIGKIPSKPTRATPPTSRMMFGAEIHWRFIGNTVVEVTPWCPTCKIELRYNMMARCEPCIECRTRYDVPPPDELVQLIVGWLRRQYP